MTSDSPKTLVININISTIEKISEGNGMNLNI